MDSPVKIDVQPIAGPQRHGTHPADPRTRATSTNPVDALTLQPADPDDRVENAQRGKNYEDSSGGLWKMYLTEVQREDEGVCWDLKGDANDILVFTGVYSATVAAFIIESYKQLSPDSGVTTNTLLSQISQQLANISSGTPLASVAAQNSQPFRPTASAVRVNVLWFLSLVISLNCALSATLMQQWARKYLKLAQYRGAPHERAPMRSFMFNGLRRFGILGATVPITGLLHISVFLFFAGLVEFLFPVYTTVAYTTLGSIGVFALPYATLTVLPSIYLDFPCGTPMSAVTWRLSQSSILGILLAIRSVKGLFHSCLWRCWTHWKSHRKSTDTPGPAKWRDTLKNQVAIRRKWLMDGLQKSVELRATDAPPNVVRDALQWTLTALDEDKEIEDFAARVPGFFDSQVVPDPTSAILPLMSDQEMTDPILGSRLYDLLKTCIPGTSPLTEEIRRRRLRVCLKCLWYCGKAYNQPERSEPLPSYVRVVFANPEMTHRIQAEEDLAARVIGRCFGALVAKKLSADIDLRDAPRVRVNDGELACLSAILGTDSREMVSLLDQPGTIELASIVSLISSSADSLVGDTMPSDVLDVFKQTLRILLSQTPPVEHLADLLRPQFALFPDIYSEAPDWLKDELQQILDKLPTGVVAFPKHQPAQPAQDSLTHISHVSLQPRENPVLIEGAPDSSFGGDLV